MDETEFVGISEFPKLKQEGCTEDIGPPVKVVAAAREPRCWFGMLLSWLLWVEGVMVEVTMSNTGPLITRSVVPNWICLTD